MVACPGCHAVLTVPDDVDAATCTACGLDVRLVDVPDRPCPRCGQTVPLVGEVSRCPACHRAVADGPLDAFVRCPRCRRSLSVGPDETDATCGHCGQEMALSDV